MFAQDYSSTYVPTQPDHVIDVYTSINRASVAAPGMTPEPSQCYIATVYRDGAYEVVIYLYLGTSNQGIIYRWDEGAVPGEQVNDLYQSAFQFAESMGFMMDDTRYREKSPEEKNEFYSQTPMFHQDLSAFATGDGGQAAGDELLIESVEEQPLEVMAEEAEEINLDVLGDGPEAAPVEEAVEEITLGGTTDDFQLDPGGAEEISLDEDPAPEPLASEEDLALSAFDEPAPEPAPELAPEPAMDLLSEPEPALELDMADPTPEPAAVEGVEEIMLDEQTMEAEPPAAALEEPALTPEEAQVLGAVEAPTASDVEEIALDSFSDPAPELAPEPEPAPEPAVDEMALELDMNEPAPAVEAAPEPAPELEPEPEAMSFESAPAGAEVEVPGDLSAEDFKILVSFLAMF